MLRTGMDKPISHDFDKFYQLHRIYHQYHQYTNEYMIQSKTSNENENINDW